MNHLAAEGIGSLIHYPLACHQQACYAELNRYECPISEAAANEVVSLPISPVMSDEQVDYVVKVVNQWRR